MARKSLVPRLDKGGEKPHTAIQNELHGLSPDVCHDILATIRHERRWQAMAAIVLIIAALLFVGSVLLFLSVASFLTCFLSVLVFLALSHFVLAALHGKEASTSWTDIIHHIRWFRDTDHR